MSWFKKAIGALFGGSDKGIIEQVSDTVDKWHPSPTTEHKMNMESTAVDNQSQDSARGMQFHTHNTRVDVIVDAANRLPRPLITFWIIGGLMGLWPLPATGQIDPVMLNIAWTVVSFWFGSRAIFKDIPKAIQTIRNLK